MKTSKTPVTITAEKELETNQVKKQITFSKRFILQTLKSSGYDSYTAIYELIDNCKDADSTKVVITYDKDKKILVVEDNGKGMSEKELLDAMDFGAEREYFEDNVGYFGVGMKTSILNLFDKDEDQKCVAFIDTFDGNNSTKISWKPMISPFDVYGDKSTKKTKGTRIEIHNVKNFYAASLKKNLGVIYFPSKNSDFLIEIVELVDDKITETVVEYNDPLYRDISNLNTNYVEAIVADEKIQINAVVLSDTIEKHSWDSAKGFNYDKGGVYFIYGGRYIEYGGTFGATTYQDPWFSKTRMEVRIPKNLTETFGVKFNKTRGIVSLENPELGDLKRKVKDLLNWGAATRKKENTKQASEEMKEETTKLVKRLNKAAAAAGFKKPETSEDTEKKKVEFTAKTNKENKEKEQNNKKPIIKERQFFDVKFEDFGIGSKFWDLGFFKNKFVITLNVSHSFYTNIYLNLTEEGRYHILNMIASLAHAQYESQTSSNLECNLEFFWENYWADFSRRLDHILKS